MKKNILCLIVLSFLFSIPTHLQIETDFKPLKQRFNGNGVTQFRLDIEKPETLKFFLDFAVKNKPSPDAVLSVSVNSHEIEQIPAKDLGHWVHKTFYVPKEQFTKGKNDISLKIIPESASYLGSDIKIYNYKGGNPQFPKVYVVFDREMQSVGSVFLSGTMSSLLRTFLTVFVAFSLCHLIVRYGFYNSFVDALPATIRVAGLITPVPWGSICYELLTPYQVVYPYATVFSLILISVTCIYVFLVFPASIFSSRMVDLILPDNIRGNSFAKQIMGTAHKAVVNVVSEKYANFSAQGFLVVLAALPVLAYGYFICRYSINIPFRDDFMIFEYLESMEKSSSLREQVELTLSAHTFHRLAVYRVVMWLIYQSVGVVDLRVGAIVGNFAIFIMLFVFYKSFLHSEKKLFFFLPVIPFFLCLNGWTIITKPVGALTIYWVHGFVILSLYFLRGSRKKEFVVAGIFAVLAIYTQGSGLTILPGGLILLLLGKKYFRGAVWFAMVGVFIGLYFYNYTFPNPGFEESSVTPIDYALFYFGFLGCSVAFAHLPVAVFAGMAIFAYLIFLTWKKYYQVNPMVFAYMVIILLIAGEAAVGRTSFGVSSALSSRYNFHSIVLILLVYISMVDLLAERPVRVRVLFAFYASLFAFTFNILTTREYLPRLEDHTQLLARELKDVAVSTRTGGGDLLRKELADPQIMDALSKGRYRLPCADIFPEEAVSHKWCE